MEEAEILDKPHILHNRVIVLRGARRSLFGGLIQRPYIVPVWEEFGCWKNGSVHIRKDTDCEFRAKFVLSLNGRGDQEDRLSAIAIEAF